MAFPNTPFNLIKPMTANFNKNGANVSLDIKDFIIDTFPNFREFEEPPIEIGTNWERRSASTLDPVKYLGGLDAKDIIKSNHDLYVRPDSVPDKFILISFETKNREQMFKETREKYLCIERHKTFTFEEQEQIKNKLIKTYKCDVIDRSDYNFSIYELCWLIQNAFKVVTVDSLLSNLAITTTNVENVTVISRCDKYSMPSGVYDVSHKLQELAGINVIYNYNDEIDL